MTSLPRILLIVCFIISGVAHAEIYKWVDKQGNVHYGDKPVNNSKQLDIKTETINTTVEPKGSRDERRQRLLDAMQEDREEKDKQKAESKEKRDKLNRQCAYAKDRLKNYERSSGLYNLDKEGNRVLLSKDERTQTIDDLRSQIKRYCK